ncbi:hypothetical protein FH966_02030 [Lentibacillus cibarius]|uniref:Uncharacterized protein n=1 Tax=Lentibacillus cibarius TaxID=2583219 RepID=A0A549YFE1_9BACI|nr:hypothetical protein [Lentibacillus cibarius]TRM10596.1 hypothetical protein FH966_02030 [Lentibacillus cibarius]
MSNDYAIDNTPDPKDRPATTHETNREADDLVEKKMKEITDSNFMFNQTMFSIGQERGDLIWTYIKENCL